MKLKILKDMDWNEIDVPIDDKTGSDVVLVSELKSEAIKHIKELEKKHNKVHKVPVNACYYCNVIDWIKHFFNITDEEVDKVHQ